MTLTQCSQKTNIMRSPKALFQILSNTKEENTCFSFQSLKKLKLTQAFPKTKPGTIWLQMVFTQD